MTDPRAMSHGNLSSSKGERGVTKRLAALASITSLQGDRLLDIGCGDGTYTRRLAEGFRQVDAVDIEPERLAVFRSTPQAGIAVHTMSADHLEFPDATFDVVTAIEVLEHVTDLDATLDEVARVLRPAGRFLVTSPNRWFPFETHGPLILGARRRPWAAPGLPWIPPLHRRCSDARAFTVTGLGRRAFRHGLRLTGHTYIMPPFDRSGLGRRVRPITDAVERSPLRFLGMALIMAFDRV